MSTHYIHIAIESDRIAYRSNLHAKLRIGFCWQNTKRTPLTTKSINRTRKRIWFDWNEKGMWVGVDKSTLCWARLRMNKCSVSAIRSTVAVLCRTQSNTHMRAINSIWTDPVYLHIHNVTQSMPATRMIYAYIRFSRDVVCRHIKATAKWLKETICLFFFLFHFSIFAIQNLELNVHVRAEHKIQTMNLRARTHTNPS